MRPLLMRAAKLGYWTVTLRLPRRLRERSMAVEVARSGLFDADYYLESNPDVLRAQIDPITHYVRHGGREGRKPSPLFDSRFYLDSNPDVAKARMNPLVHFLRFGAAEGRDPNPMFDTRFYLAQNPYVGWAGINPLKHYLRVGAETGRSPHPDFDGDWYLQTYDPELGPGANALAHYLEVGRHAGRHPSARSARLSHGEVDTAVVLHLYYPDLWPQIRTYLQNLGAGFDLFVSLSKETGAGAAAQIHSDYPEAVICFYENRGRDIAPFLEFLRDPRIEKYRYVCKIHSKRSPHRVDGDRWRAHLLQKLLGAPLIVNEIRRIFDQDSRVGIVGPASQLDASEESWGSNQERMRELVERMDLSSERLDLEFFAGSMFWFRPAALRPLRKLGLRVHDFETERGQLDGTLHHAIERIFNLVTRSEGFRIVPFEGPGRLPRPSGRARRFRLIAFYLPQYHPIPENDRWWGSGFTEWTNVANARPLYSGHLQPRIPKDLGFYDLRVPETRAAQAQLAQRYGIHGFCYYYYWFDGKKLLERPLAETLASGRPDFPFCICWANESWTRRWDGQEQDVLIQQSYSPDGNLRFIRDVIPILKDRRYIRYEGKPLLAVYRAKEIPDVEETLEMWRRECRAQGVGEIHLCAVRFYDIVDVHTLGFDAAIDFPPHHLNVEDVSHSLPGLSPEFDGLIYDYETEAQKSLERCGHGYEHPAHRGVMLAWDNTARRGRSAHVAHGATPAAYRRWLRGVMEQELEFNRSPESLIFINAWNEWGEGAALEPDMHFGSGFLEATRDALRSIEEVGERAPGADVEVGK